MHSKLGQITSSRNINHHQRSIRCTSINNTCIF